VAEAATAERRGTTVPAPVEAVFSEQEIDSFVDVWLEQSGYRDSVLRHLDDPVVRLHDGMLVLAGKPRTGKRILSMHFRPTLSDDGLVELMLEKLTAGDLPVPGMIVEQFGERAVERWETDLAHRLPPLQQQARIAPDGVANRATFVVDPNGIIRFVEMTDMSVGRNPQEVLRVLGRVKRPEDLEEL
ncbi:MAG TPA: hypothetical protein PKB10_10500, partial [Tepidisphaeraceae bacterium]|nr:hypothetical protein [Tepidisphaeraceae bacterium]